MLAKRIIPTLLCRGSLLVKGSQFRSWRTVGMVEQAVRIHQARGVDELVLLDIEATWCNRRPDCRMVERLTRNCFMPLAVGGGITCRQDVQDLLNAGADKVVIGTRALEHPWLVQGLAARFGCQAVVASLDVCGSEAYTRCGSHRIDDKSVTALAVELQELGAGEILLQAIDREGMMMGYDLDLIRKVSGLLTIPVIASGGAGTYEHMRQAIEAGADAVAAGAMFQFTNQTPKGAAQYLSNHGIEARQ